MQLVKDKGTAILKKEIAILLLEKDKVQLEKELMEKDAKIKELQQDLAVATHLAEQWTRHQGNRQVTNKKFQGEAKKRQMQALLRVTLPNTDQPPSVPNELIDCINHLGNKVEGMSGKMTEKVAEMSGQLMGSFDNMIAASVGNPRAQENQNVETSTNPTDLEIDSEDHHCEHASESEEES